MLYDDAGANTIKRTITMINFLLLLNTFVMATILITLLEVCCIRLFELFKILRKEIFSNDKGICF